LPGDASFLRATRLADQVVYPLIRKRRVSTVDGSDMVSLLCRAPDENGDPMDDHRVRNDVVSMFTGASETSAVTLAWLGAVLDLHPAGAERLFDEIDRVVGDGPPVPAQLAELTYTKLFLQELLRLYPVGWVIPRMAVADDIVDGVLVKGGSTVLVSPYLA